MAASVDSQKPAHDPINAAEMAEHWSLVRTPLGVEWSGRARYAAAMFFFQHGLMSADVLEVYRICSRLDAEDPLAILRDRGIGASWFAQLATNEALNEPGQA